jgi:O-antigen/teichoic acid export membrane protein
MGAKVSDDSKKLAIDTLHVALSAICVGVLSVLMPVVGARVLEAPELSMLLSSWALVNTIQFGLLTPIENFAPRYRSSALSQGHSDRRIANFLTRYALAASGVAAFIMLMFLLVVKEKSSNQFIIGSLFFILSNGLLASQRSLLIAQGKFRSILRKNMIVAFVGVAGFALIVTTSWSYAGAVYLAFGAANAAGYLMERFDKANTRVDNDFEIPANPIKTETKSFERTQLTRLGVLSLTTISALLLTNGTIIASKMWHVNSKFIVAYSAALNIALVLYVLLNSITPPIYNKALIYFEDGSLQELKRLFMKSLLGFMIATLGISLSLGAIGPWVLKIYIGSTYAISNREFLLIAFGEGLATLTVIPKVFLIAINRDRKLFPIWISGVCVFILLFFEISDKRLSMLVVPIAAASVIVALATIIFFKSIAAPRRKRVIAKF